MELYLLIACVILSAAAAVFAALSLKRAAREQEGEEALRAELAQLRAMQEERERALRRELADATQRTVGKMCIRDRCCALRRVTRRRLRHLRR